MEPNVSAPRVALPPVPLRLLLAGLVFGIVIPGGLFLGCKGEKTSTRPDPVVTGGQVPPLPRPAVRTTLVFEAGSDTARQARSVVFGRLQQVRLEFTRCLELLESLDALALEELAPGVWMTEVPFSFPGCRAQYKVTMEPDAMTWGAWLNGPCTEAGSFSNAQMLDMRTTLDARWGRLDDLWIAGRECRTRVTWESDPDWDVILWTRYSERTEMTSPGTTLRVRHDPDGTEQSELSRAGQYRWTARIARDGRSGSFALYRWSGPDQSWAVSDEIDWAAPHGTWRVTGVGGDTIETTW